jgi:hypothetical protein
MSKKRALKLIRSIIIILVIIFIILFLIRFFSKRELDDVSPRIPCDQELLKKSDVLYVIPAFDNIPISDNQTWCSSILSLNKTLALHGVYHNYQEFLKDRNQEYLDKGIEIFEKCFDKRPESFKPPQLKITENNKNIIKKNFRLKLRINQIFHKVYHCNDSGLFSNDLIDFY